MIIRKNYNPKNNCIFESVFEKIRYFDTETSDKELCKNPHFPKFSIVHKESFASLKNYRNKRERVLRCT